MSVNGSMPLTIFLLIMLVGGVALQIFLSKRQNKWLGLILPAITFCYALMMLLGVAIFDNMGAVDILGLLISVFLLGNIPTIVLLGIYFACREKLKRSREMEKMNVQDLS